MRTLLPILAAPVLLSACGSGISGIWLFQIQYLSPTDEVCDATIGENFTEAHEPADEEEEEDTATSSRSDTLVFGDIQTGAKGEAVLVIEGNVYPGVKNDGGSWTFSWQGTQTASDSQDQESYHFEKSEDYASTETFDLTFDKSTATGTMEGQDTSDLTYKETDFLEGMVPPDLQSQLPANRWLVVPNEEGIPLPASNRFDADDCDGDYCELTISQTCGTVQQITATHTGYEDADDYGAIAGARQASGI